MPVDADGRTDLRPPLEVRTERLSRSDTLRDNVAELATTWPLQALGVRSEVERWQRPLTEPAVAAAREAGHSWAEIGNALGISRQSVHERFRNITSRNPPDAAPPASGEDDSAPAGNIGTR